MRQWIYKNDSWEKKTYKANLILISSTKRRSSEARRGTVTLQKQRRIGFALSAFVVHVCELWLKTEDSLSTLGPFCPIVSHPLPYPPAQKIQTAAQSDTHPLYSALSHWAGLVQTQTQRPEELCSSTSGRRSVSVMSYHCKDRWVIGTKAKETKGIMWPNICRSNTIHFQVKVQNQTDIYHM